MTRHIQCICDLGRLVHIMTYNMYLIIEAYMTPFKCFFSFSGVKGHRDLFRTMSYCISMVQCLESCTLKFF